jgi:hypothetical protein
MASKYRVVWNEDGRGELFPEVFKTEEGAEAFGNQWRDKKERDAEKRGRTTCCWTRVEKQPPLKTRLLEFVWGAVLLVALPIFLICIASGMIQLWQAPPMILTIVLLPIGIGLVLEELGKKN